MFSHCVNDCTSVEPGAVKWTVSRTILHTGTILKWLPSRLALVRLDPALPRGHGIIPRQKKNLPPPFRPRVTIFNWFAKGYNPRENCIGRWIFTTPISSNHLLILPDAVCPLRKISIADADKWKLPVVIGIIESDRLGIFRDSWRIVVDILATFWATWRY